ncbi:general amidase [Epithele typhae]|uniref:general amidase n=1 Tax=Epithele typhae TaxID=378194 RepID=UPI0020078F82|nr:general amidase [Epithele typhae]KAH9944406.1 general amidase [Epithele typhae]
MGSWQDLVADKKLRQQAAIPLDWVLKSPPAPDVLDVRTFPDSPQCGVLSEREITITNAVDVELLLAKLASGEWSSVEVTTAYYKRAIIAHQLVNCLTEIFVDRALQRARELDEHLKTTGKVVGPLHGLPISLKDQIPIKGLECTMGYASWIGRYFEKDAVMTQVLYACGAVPFVMTNVPQTLMWSETYNLVFGRTSNPANRTLTCGGSSGGEGALGGMKGTPLGIGSDIGGSVRYPSAFNGLYGLRPSYHRIPYSGCVNSLMGQDSAPSVLGPISGSLSGVRAFMKAVIGQQPWLLDPLVVRKRWIEEEYQLADHGFGKQLCFALMEDDGIVLPHPPLQRAMKMTADALRAAGHKGALRSCFAAIWLAGALEDIDAVTAASGEPRIESMAMPGAQAVDTGMGYPAGISAYENWQLHKQRTALREEYLALWQASAAETGTGRPVDAIILPVAPSAAPPHGKSIIATYTVLGNIMNYPACVFPVTTVDPVQDPVQKRETFMSPTDEENYNLYHPDTFKNAPVSLQLMGQTLEEEAVLAMTEIVDNALKSKFGVVKK